MLSKISKSDRIVDRNESEDGMTNTHFQHFSSLLAHTLKLCNQLYVNQFHGINLPAQWKGVTNPTLALAQKKIYKWPSKLPSKLTSSRAFSPLEPLAVFEKMHSLGVKASHGWPQFAYTQFTADITFWMGQQAIEQAIEQASERASRKTIFCHEKHPIGTDICVHKKPQKKAL